MATRREPRPSHRQPHRHRTQHRHRRPPNRRLLTPDPNSDVSPFTSRSEQRAQGLAAICQFYLDHRTSKNAAPQPGPCQRHRRHRLPRPTSRRTSRDHQRHPTRPGPHRPAPLRRQHPSHRDGRAVRRPRTRPRDTLPHRRAMARHGRPRPALRLARRMPRTTLTLPGPSRTLLAQATAPATSTPCTSCATATTGSATNTAGPARSSPTAPIPSPTPTARPSPAGPDAEISYGVPNGIRNRRLIHPKHRRTQVHAADHDGDASRILKASPFACWRVDGVRDLPAGGHPQPGGLTTVSAQVVLHANRPGRQ